MSNAIPLISNGLSTALFAVIPEVPSMETCATGIAAICRVIQAICKHVITKDTLTDENEGIGIDESADSGVVITALQIIEPGILGGGLAILPFLSDYPWFSKKRKPGTFRVVVAAQRLSTSQL